MTIARVVDAHHHLWRLGGKLRYPWLEHPEPISLGDYSAIRRDYPPEEYRRDTRGWNVIATVYVEAETDHQAPLEESAWVHEVNRLHGFPNAVVAHAWIDVPESEEVLAAQKRFPLVRGIRTKPVTSRSPAESVRGQPRSMQDEKWLRGLALLEKYDLSWDLRVPYWHLPEAAEVARMFPGLRIALNHTGNIWDRTPEALAIWRRGMEGLAACPNVAVKISGLCQPGLAWTLGANRPVIRETVAMFGPARCMFASNFPVDGVRASWDYIYGCFGRAVADFPEADRDAMFAGNALGFYRIAT